MMQTTEAFFIKQAEDLKVGDSKVMLDQDSDQLMLVTVMEDDRVQLLQNRFLLCIESKDHKKRATEFRAALR
ncbi:MAG: hypothetical protein K0Q73_7830 [Paenibacillus sp.]|nr:hypothetical protein [Paenibacillus sp.]